MLHGGSGPPSCSFTAIRTHVMWHLVAPRLAEHFTVVAPDLRGYGESSKPPTAPDHEPYSKRAMARDGVGLMRALGHETDAPCSAGGTEPSSPAPLPERLIGADPDAYYFRGATDIFAPDALADYRRAVRDPEMIHAMCEDYRAGATYDYELDEADQGAGRRISSPLLVLWGGRGDLGELCGDPLAVWREWAEDVSGRALDCGHYLAEEAPEETYAELRAFFA